MNPYSAIHILPCDVEAYLLQDIGQSGRVKREFKSRDWLDRMAGFLCLTMGRMGGLGPLEEDSPRGTRGDPSNGSSGMTLSVQE